MNDSRQALKKIIANSILANNSRLSGARYRTTALGERAPYALNGEPFDLRLKT
ncbi:MULTISPECIES: hypothetical protein [Microcoleaceae]|uniref:hypothetical protein n=1 Tax=Microcoleaceae TaxID=1892252 RepID=UPI001882AFA8|nr:hypothetical protein [Tychonema sp. LEGE 06208]MBE9161721.1 hypothetical protein [Tychonema sp. LEGE 06208]